MRKADATLFQSTRPRGARRELSGWDLSKRGFQSTRPRGARQRGGTVLAGGSGFQSTRPRGARPPEPSDDSWFWKFQSTRPRGARPNARIKASREAVVSIHAPTRGATPYRAGAQLIGYKVSIHAPTRGATTDHRRWWHKCICFNPRAHAGRDPSGSPSGPAIQVSIHAPTRGATIRVLIQLLRLYEFQSTRPRGARPNLRACFAVAKQVSIHAPTRGATLFYAFLYHDAVCFNPRAHAGRDQPVYKRVVEG